MDLNLELTRLFIFWMAVSFCSFVLSCFIAYYVIKCAIRDGIKESGLIDTWESSSRRIITQQVPDLPRMTTD